MRFVEYLMMCRLHSSGVTISVVLLGLILAGGRVFSLTGLLFLVFGLIWHVVGFISNDFCDRELDTQSKKTWKPLVTGTVPLLHAELIILYGLLAFLFLGIMLSSSRIAVIALFAATSTGFAYNYSKSRTVFSPIFAVLAYSFLIAFPYFSIHPAISPVIILAMLYVAFMQLYQIAYSGFYKDIEEDPNNLLKALGSGTAITIPGGIPTFEPNWLTRIFGWSVKSSNVVVGLLLWSLLATSNWTLIPLLFLFVVLFYFVYQQTISQVIIKKKMLFNCVVVEVCSFYSFLFIIFPLLTTAEFVLFAVYPLAWFIIFNRIQWGKGWWLQPHV